MQGVPSPVSAEFLPLLGVRPALGRFFTAQEDRDSAKVLVLGYDFWQRSLGGDSAVLGRVAYLGKDPYTIIGVAQRGFTGIGLYPVTAWQPAGPSFGAGMLIRLKPGVDPRQVEAGATLAFRQLRLRGRPVDSTGFILLGPLIAARGPVRQSQEMGIAPRIAGVAAIILVITVANVATLLLVRGARRRREMAVRLALGISRRRLFAQLVAEGVLLALIGGMAALLVAGWGGATLRTMLLWYLPRQGPPITGRVLWFMLGVTVVAGVVAGLFPALRATRPISLSPSRPAFERALRTGRCCGPVWWSRRPLCRWCCWSVPACSFAAWSRFTELISDTTWTTCLPHA